ncbi:MAG: cytochrome c biogenesis CcdA family protein, partial [Actinomycetota bacterium]
ATYLGVEEAGSSPRRRGRALEGLAVGGAVTSGFVVVFAAIGLLISLAGQLVTRQFPSLVVILGLLLLGLGVWTAAGGRLPFTVPAPGRPPASRGLKGAFIYGVVYGLVSLGCTLPVFLVVVGSAFSEGHAASGLVLFLIYSAGMGTVVTALAVGTALLRGLVKWVVRQAMPYVHRASGALLCAAGAYLIVRELNQPRPNAGWLDRLDAGTVVAASIAAAGILAGLLSLRTSAPRHEAKARR